VGGEVLMASDSLSTGPFEESWGKRKDRLCDDFEDAWREGHKPRIEDYVRGLPEPQRGQLLSNLLDVELEFRLAGGEKPTVDEYERRFPLDAALVRPAFVHAGCLAPEWIDRFQVLRTLGSGSFGRVYLCYDEKLHREVALKVPRPDRLSSAEAREWFLREARNVAGLRHEAIVTLHDFGETEGQCYLVYEYIAGGNLVERLKQFRLSQYQAAKLIERIADALQHAHGEEVYHRDIKPANILLDQRGQPYLADFGLAVRVPDLADERGRGVGTAPYMAPELVRGDGDQIDGRADIYSLGVVLYELLTGRRPFEGRNRQEIYDKILSGREPRPPREINPGLHPELQEICLKAIARSVSGRYLTAGDLADKLHRAAELLTQPEATPKATPPCPEPPPQPSSSPLPVPVLPKGLRSFGPEDQAFFLELLPGPREAHRLPESVQFWKLRIESADADTAFPLGLMYGPSGCGKSSLVKAGLLPVLGPSVVAVYVEATREHTEERILGQLRTRCPGLGPRACLRTTFARLRQNRGLPAGAKVLVVLDQFEQWLHAHAHDMENTELVAALRQADGVHVQTLLLVRSDFWMSISRLFDSLRINLDRAHNARAVDLFGEGHAHHVLHLFGTAYGQLPPGRAELTKEQTDFLALAVRGLSAEGDVIPVRLSLFAEMMKKRPWTPAEFAAVGGMKGIGRKFLEEVFSQPALQASKAAAQAVLQCLLPAPGADLKGRMRSQRELAEHARLAEDSPALAQLLTNLNREYLLTPTDAPAPTSGAGEPPDDATPGPQATYYQLTHDYLVPALREWISAEKGKTWTGWAELRVAERAALWNARPQNQLLPPWWEWASVRLLTRRRTWTEPQRRMMGVAGRHHTVWAGVALAVLLLVGWAVFEVMAYRRARELVHALREVKPTTPLTEMEQIDRVIRALSQVRGWAKRLLEDEAERTAEHSQEQQRACLGLALLDLELKPAQVVCLCRWLLTANKPDELELAARVLPRLELHVDQVATFMGQALQTSPRADGPDVELQDQLACARANAALALIRLGRAGEPIWRLLQSSKDPRLRTYLIHQSCLLGLNPELLTGKLREAPSAGILQALLLSLGGYPSDCLPEDKREALLAELRSLYKDHPDSGVHSAAEWVLRQWRQTVNVASLPDIDKQLALNDRDVQRLGILDPLGGRRWYLSNAGQHTLAVVRGHVTFLMDDPPRPETIPRSFAIATKEVTVAQFLKFRKDHPYKADFSQTPDSPMINISWFDAAQFCNWLSKQDGIDPKDWCYPVEIKPGMTLSENFLDRIGYRLPTEAEWEYACRAGTLTTRSYGTSGVLLKEYCWYAENSDGRTHPVGEKKPNDWGFFDMYGNAQEWCHDAFEKSGFLRITRDESRVLKGGTFLSPAYMVNSSTHIVYSPIKSGDSMGFRVARTLR
jgi:serine/threonine protein kinase/formylglycine-generating enzyme required for sulfatase activity